MPNKLVKHQVEINSTQVEVVLECLERFCDENKSLEMDFNTSKADRKALREERLEIEMLINQIRALEWYQCQK